MRSSRDLSLARGPRGASCSCSSGSCSLSFRATSSETRRRGASVCDLKKKRRRSHRSKVLRLWVIFKNAKLTTIFSILKKERATKRNRPRPAAVRPASRKFWDSNFFLSWNILLKKGNTFQVLSSFICSFFSLLLRYKTPNSWASSELRQILLSSIRTYMYDSSEINLCLSFSQPLRIPRKRHLILVQRRRRAGFLFHSLSFSKTYVDDCGWFKNPTKRSWTFRGNLN